MALYALGVEHSVWSNLKCLAFGTSQLRESLGAWRLEREITNPFSISGFDKVRAPLLCSLAYGL
jgi:hypothetical protein